MNIDRNALMLKELLKKHGNNVCADCGSQEIEYASYNIGVYLCKKCANVHSHLGSHVSKVKHLTLDHWEDSQIERLKQVGNNTAKYKYEVRVPPYFRRPNKDRDPPIVLEQWILAKYLREEFISHDKQQAYHKGEMDGFLMKKGREDPRFFPRKFVLENGTIRYYVKENKNPKAIIPLDDLSMFLAPEKLGNPSSLQISYLKDGSTRHIYVYHDDPETLMQWYQAIRTAKMQRLKAMYPNTTEAQLLSGLPQDALMEGWLWKAGPSPSYAHRKRWVTLDHRKLMYHNDQLDAYPKGEIFLGSCHEFPFKSQEELEHAAASVGVKDVKDLYAFGSYKISLGGFGLDKLDPSRHGFSLHTPYRTFVMASESVAERDRWVTRIREVLNKEITPRDIALCANLIRKRNGSNPLSLLTGR